jgi:hypothetical protein
MTGLTQCPDVVIHSGTLSFFVVLFCSASEKRTTDEMGSTMLPQANWRLSATA